VQKHPARVAAHQLSLQWDDVRYFLELARIGSLSGAARRLGVDHSTVARRVQALEESLRIRLFDRLPKGWSMTAEGEVLADQAMRLEAEALSFSRLALGVASLHGTVRVSAPPMLAGYFLAPRLAAARSQWANIDLELIGEARDANLARGEADLAIRMFRPAAPGLAARHMGDLGYGLYAARDYIQRTEVDWEYLGYDDSLAQVPQEQWLNSVAGARRFIFRSNDLAALINAARGGLGIAVLPHFAAAQDPALIQLEAPICPVNRQIWLVMHPDVKRSPRVRLVANLLVDIVAQAQDLLSGRLALPASAGEQAGEGS
jgi:DNA-binding transcriptional LysR family regulator